MASSAWNWMQGQQDAAKAKAEAEKEPSACGLCGKKIEEDDAYYVGFTHETEDKLVWAFTCTQKKCTNWLKHKERKTKEKE